ncbi:Putative Actin cytoskeleton protein [Aspergillus calidoustus]|uniref:Putative Actin cytoskeleton protein n=1 Tax=Aspergillus calidoustus TaxID=454130 RepID=A0A0U5C1P4_ASPCI|nr:Putative Actin cytoskeleton protein [Aspergillus calidoustus]
MSDHTTVHVSGISPSTTEKEVQDFFSFCGKIVSISVTPTSSEPDASKSATVTFEKDAAAKTALLLDQTKLGSSIVHVEAAQSIDDLAGSHSATASEAKDEHNHDLEQEDKPRSRIIAEYLAHGYTISDQAIQKAISLDQKHGFSARFTNALSNFDKKTGATDRAKGLDESYKISDKASSGWRGLHSYFEKALGTPSGQKLREFYAQTDKQVRDIHSEARRLADLKSGKAEKSETEKTETEKPTEGDTSTSAAAAAAPAGAVPPGAETAPGSATFAEKAKFDS